MREQRKPTNTDEPDRGLRIFNFQVSASSALLLPIHKQRCSAAAHVTRAVATCMGVSCEQEDPKSPQHECPWAHHPPLYHRPPASLQHQRPGQQRLTASAMKHDFSCKVHVPKLLYKLYCSKSRVSAPRKSLKLDQAPQSTMRNLIFLGTYSFATKVKVRQVRQKS